MNDYGYSTRELISNDPAFRASVEELRNTVLLGEAWRDILAGRGTVEQAKLAFTDLVIESGYFAVTPAGTTADVLQRNEGKREIMARILFLSDMPSSAITQLRRDALDELQKIEERAQHG